MSITSLIVGTAERLLPLDLARTAALPPVRAARMGAVAVARTVRHWELALGGDADRIDDIGDDRADHPQPRPVPVPATVDLREQEAADLPDGEQLGSSDLPVEGWAELSFADAQARIAECDADDLRTLLAYEQAHGHRAQFTLLLENRLAHSSV